MQLTAENKAKIDAMSYHELLLQWRFAPSGDPWFQGETGTYWQERMKALRAADPTVHVTESKRLGW
jgi:hypothetical protein